MSRNANFKRKGNKLNIRFIPALIIAIAVFVSMTMVGPIDVQAAAESTIAFSQGASVSATVGDDFVLTPTINTGTNAVSIVALRITFDQTRLQLDSITPSTTFGTAESSTTISNTNGTASVDLSVGNANPSVTGTYAVATLNFSAIATGAASVAFTGTGGTTGAAADGETGDVIITRTPSTVTVEADPGDTTPPTLSSGSPSGALAAGTTQTTVSLSTNETATCKFSQTAGTAYASMSGTFTTTGSTSHSMTAAGLTNGTSYNYYVRCSDTSDNVTTSDYAISFSVSNATVITSSDDDDDGDSHKKEKEKKKKRKITNSKAKVSRGQVLTQRGKRFSKKSIVLLYFSKPGGGYYTPMKIMTSKSGAFVTSYRVNKPTGKYNWYAVDQKTGKKSKVVTYTVR